MNVRKVMTRNPVCCLPEDTAQTVASMMCEYNVGSIPVVADIDSQKLIGIVTDRDLCCTIIAQGLDPSATTIMAFMREGPVSCRPEENLESCERAMQKHQVRRIPVVDEQGRCIGIVAQADLVLALDPQHAYQTVAEISRTRTVTA
jgi:CBS domain-containing protein